jgi:hypothetical protein
MTFIGWVDHKRLPVERLNEREIFEKYDFRRNLQKRGCSLHLHFDVILRLG